jgi:hypothetical protein
MYLPEQIPVTLLLAGMGLLVSVRVLVISYHIKKEVPLTLKSER